jgi:alanyl-tRNA synthetase
MKSEQIRKEWKKFWKDKDRNHKQLSPAPLVPQ